MTKKVSERIKVRRSPERARYDQKTIHGILDDALICHVAFVVGGQPFNIPMALVRDGENVLLHGPVKGRLTRHLATGGKACLTVTHLDGLVLAKSQFHHSMNYRSAILFGTCREITDADEKVAALEKLVAHLAPGQEKRARPGNKSELKATSLLVFEIEEASAKVREGAPIEAKGDKDLDLWSGVLPLALKADDPVTEEGGQVPENIRALYDKLSR